MANLLNPLLGLLLPNLAGRRDPTPPPPRPRAIVGGAAARELCMLPKDTSVDVVSSIGAKRAVQLKADGIRALYVEGRIVSREGVPLGCAMHAQPPLARLEEAFGHEMVFDGEYVAADGFNATIGEMQRGEGGGTFWLFDALPAGAWVAGGSERPLKERLAALRDRLDASDSPFVGMLGWWELDGPATVAKARELWELGYEGVVTKRLDSPYVRDRSPDWLRLKRTFTRESTIIDVLEKGGKLRGIMVKGPDDLPPFKIGRGWTPEEEAEIMRRRFTGNLTVEVSYQLTTGTTRSVRGAVFHRLRIDKGVTA